MIVLHLRLEVVPSRKGARDRIEPGLFAGGASRDRSSTESLPMTTNSPQVLR
jgi:hypothetical protein